MTKNQPPTPEKSMTFTNQIPTVPGAYYYREKVGALVFLLDIQLDLKGTELWVTNVGLRRPKDMNGEWSSILIPADEIEKAFREALQHFPVLETTKIVLWTDSRACKIAKGEEV